MRELIIDSFAGGGGASTGIEMALGISPDIAINHDAEALAMHRANHPGTRHLNTNIWRVDPGEATAGHPVGLAWFSPDCKHFSKAKGGRPVSRNIRDLAWVVVLWAKRARPRVILLENVEEFRDWGPITADGQPCKDRKGQTFERWLGELRRLGYKVEWRELRACDYGAPTIRKRLFLIARRDGLPIVWPQPTHGAPDSAEVLAGTRQPWRTAAEIIDWTLPCHSIFLTPEEARLLGVKRPLADATMARIAKGVKRYVIDAARPFIVNLTHGGRVEDSVEPIKTVTGAHRGEKAVVTPYLVSVAQGDSGGRREYPIDDPIGTVTGGGISHALVAPIVGHAQQGGRTRSADTPLHTVTASSKDQNQIVVPHITKFRNGAVGHDMDAPLATVTANSHITRPGGAPPLGVVAATLTKFSENSIGCQPDEPLHTVMAGAPRHGLVAASLTSYYGDGAGGKDRSASVDDPVKTVVTENRHAVVAAFLAQHNTERGGAVKPGRAVTTKDRMGLVLVNGEPYEIADIGMRMLTPRELFRAQGFSDSYVIDRGVAADGLDIRLTKTAQIRMCGNSVCPPMAAALVRANYTIREIAAAGDDAGPLFQAGAA